MEPRSSPMHTGRGRLVATSLAALLLVAGCSDDASPRSTASVSSTSAVTTVAENPAGSAPASTPTGPAVSVDPTVDPTAALDVVAGIPLAIDLSWRPGDDTLYVATQDGTVLAVGDGGQPRLVLDVTGQTAAAGERGLLGLAMDPKLALAYVNFTNRDGDTVVAEFAVGEDGTFDRRSQREVLTIDQPYANHNGGAIRFGPDGYLYIATGDGGSANDPARRALKLDDLLGKILRIDPHASGSRPYSVPADNPFAAGGGRGEVWSYGLRNPWRFSFDRQTGDLWIADVGQNEIEEVDVAWAAAGGGRGSNFGWSAFEGTKRLNADQPTDGAIPPIYEYTHADGGCSISGGVRYRGTGIPALVGWYVFSDYCKSSIRALQIDGQAAGRVVELGDSSQVAGISEGPDGELYVLSLEDGLVMLVP